MMVTFTLTLNSCQLGRILYLEHNTCYQYIKASSNPQATFKALFASAISMTFQAYQDLNITKGVCCNCAEKIANDEGAICPKLTCRHEICSGCVEVPVSKGGPRSVSPLDELQVHGPYLPPIPTKITPVMQFHPPTRAQTEPTAQLHRFNPGPTQTRTTHGMLQQASGYDSHVTKQARGYGDGVQQSRGFEFLDEQQFEKDGDRQKSGCCVIL